MADIGRPRIVDTDTLLKLKHAFVHGATDEEACIEAEISPRTLYKYQEENPEFLAVKSLWKQDTSYRAKINVSEKIRSGDVPQSNWWLERKNRQEFSTKVEQEQSGGITVKWEDMNEEILTPSEVDVPVEVSEPVVENVVAEEVAEAITEVVEPAETTEEV